MAAADSDHTAAQGAVEPQRWPASLRQRPLRTEHDSMGDIEGPDSAYYGASTQRTVDNAGVHSSS